MENLGLKNKERIVVELNMKFDEVAELFSVETLDSMRMDKVVGGAEASDGTKIICTNLGNCGNCNCTIICTTSNGVLCTTLTLPSLPKPEWPTLATPTLAKN